jgi:LPXTG-motif cell wall-anchored protein
MIQRFLLCSLLVFSLSCFGQVVINGGYASNVAPNAALAPVTSTPDIALPGSGPAVGAPLNNTNDSRFSTGPSIASRNEIVDVVSATNENAEGAPESATTAAPNGTNTPTASANQPFDVGIQHFVSGAPGAANTGLSLAEIVTQVRAQAHAPARVFTNDSIQQLNARGVRTGNLEPPSSDVNAANTAAPNTAAPNTNPEPNGTLMAQNEAGPLPQSDQSAPQSRTANQRRETPSTQAPSENAPAPSASADQNANAAPANNNASALPQTGSSLPLLLLIGFVGLAAGSIYFVRR